MSLVTINAVFKKPGDIAQTGKLRVSLSYPLKDETTIYTTEATDFPLVSGAVTFQLRNTDISQVPYLFQLVKTVTLTPTPPDEGEPFDVEEIVWQFEALVPYSATPIDLSDLFEETGIAKDYRDQSVLNLVRYLSYSQPFIDSIGQRLFKHQGAWSNTAIYRYGNLVSNSGHTYMYVGIDPTSGNDLSNNTYWRMLV